MRLIPELLPEEKRIENSKHIGKAQCLARAAFFPEAKGKEIQNSMTEDPKSKRSHKNDQFLQSDQVNPAIQTRSGPANETLPPRKNLGEMK